MKRKGGRRQAPAPAVVVLPSAATEERTRDTERLFVHSATVRCAEQHRCRACCYKIVLYGRAGLLPNVRPELCPRMASTDAKQSSDDASDAQESSNEDTATEAAASTGASIGLYDAGEVKRILTVGDGNFSYSLALATAFQPIAADASTRVELVATSHESRDTILETYPDGERILDALHAMTSHVRVEHEVDATNATQMQALGQFDRVIWNFPCVRAPRGEDGQNKEMEANKQLLADFFAHVGAMLTPTGEVHVTHKTKAPFGQWGIEKIAESHGLRHERSVIFDRCLYPGYSNKKVLSKGSFPIWDSQTFVFVPASRAADAATESRVPVEPVTPEMLKKMYLLLSPTIQDRLDAASKHKKKKPNKQNHIVIAGTDTATAGDADGAEAKAGHKHKAEKRGLQTKEKRKRPPQPPGKMGHQKRQKLRARK